jgi:hypothetical protein
MTVDNQSHQAMDTYIDPILKAGEDQMTTHDGNINSRHKPSHIKFSPELLKKFALQNPPPARPAVLVTWSINDTDPLLKTAYLDLQHFARRGGPDLSNLRRV